jgi:hypothetical protein
MADREQLEKRVADLEAEVVRLRRATYRGVRKRSSVEVAGLPLWAIAVGPDPEKGEVRGHAKAIIAVGDMATGVVAIGGLARGVVALGGLAVGLVSLGGLAIGLLLAVGGGAIGGLALGGGAAGGVAVGGGAAGYYACGGTAYGHAVVAPMRQDPEAEEFFRAWGLEGLCRAR